jgi:hypothetical protein
LAQGSDEEIYPAFKQIAFQLQRRIELFNALPFEKLDRLQRATLTSDIGNDVAKARQS